MAKTRRQKKKKLLKVIATESLGSREEKLWVGRKNEVSTT